MKIGFPRALYYFDYFPFWAGFFYGLGIEIVTSPPTHREIMEQGLKKASDETCLPLKLLAGHVQALKDVDAIFMPRIVSVESDTYSCPKFLGIPESLYSAVPPGIPVLTVTINWRKGQRQVLKDLIVFGAQLGKDKNNIRYAFKLGNKWQKKFHESRGTGWDFEESLREVGRDLQDASNCHNAEESKWDAWKEWVLATMHLHTRERSFSRLPLTPVKFPESNRLRIALVGHSYLIQEPYANLNLLGRLREQVEVVQVQHVNQDAVDAHLLGLRKKLFWNHAQQIFGAGCKFVKDSKIDGIIYLSCFGCGTDSIVQELLARRAREQHKPYMVVTLDEHSGEAGLVTRIEAFLDMVERRRAHEGYVSTYGERLDCDSNTF